jgi:hypothetical protein
MAAFGATALPRRFQRIQANYAGTNSRSPQNLPRARLHGTANSSIKVS